MVPLLEGGLQLDDLREKYVGSDAKVILEIGSNGGPHTIQFLDLFLKSKVYCFEPDRRAAARWRTRIDDPRAMLFECAVGSFDGEADFHVSSGQHPRKPRITDFDQAGSLRAPKTCLTRWPWLQFKGTTKIKVVTLDTWAREHNIDHIDLIWADVQGAEGDLLDGARETISKADYFYTEYSNSEWYDGQITLPEIVERLKDNFDMVARWKSDALFKNKRHA